LTTPAGNIKPERFRVTHPFHPLSGREFEVLARHRHWNEDRVFFEHSNGNQIWISADFTSLAPVDPFVTVSAGRAHFRVEDLLQLSRLIGDLRR
jgi:hypothetical protein